MSLEAVIKDKIKSSGPISVSDYMELCLSHPVHGYYIKQDPFGQRGDFITAPEISQVFGELIGIWCASVWQQLGSEPSALVEIGPGRGTLMQDALRATRHVEGFHDHLTVHMIETSPVLQTVQFHTLQNAHERIEWIDSLDDLPEKPILLIANEFFDALPIRQHVQTANGLRERRVGIDEATGELCFVQDTGGLSLAKGSSKIKEGTIIESCQAAKAAIGKIADHIREYGGAALIIDYGYLGDSHQDTLQAVKNHLFHPVLKDPGDADITAHVDFATLMEVAADHGVAVHGVAEQGKFLVRCGVEMRTDKLLEQAYDEEAVQLISGVKRLIDPNQMGELFKVIALVGDHRIMPAGMYVSHRL